MNRSALKGFYLSLLFIALIICDALSKYWIFESLPSWKEIPIFNDFFGIDFTLRFVKNYGAAWGLFSSYQEWLLALRIFLIIGLLGYVLFWNRHKKWEIPLVLLIAGAVGNVLDSYFYGFVIDFLQFTFWGYHFAVFNIADAAVSVGVLWLFIVGDSHKQTV